MWQVSEQNFDEPEIGPGRIIVALADGHTLSIITNARNEFIREARSFSPAAILGYGWAVTDVQADDGEFEIALLNEWGNCTGEAMNPEPDGWHAHQYMDDGDVLYTHVTPAMLDRLVNAVGLREGEA